MFSVKETYTVQYLLSFDIIWNLVVISILSPVLDASQNHSMSKCWDMGCLKKNWNVSKTKFRSRNLWHQMWQKDVIAVISRIESGWQQELDPWMAARSKDWSEPSYCSSSSPRAQLKFLNFWIKQWQATQANLEFLVD